MTESKSAVLRRKKHTGDRTCRSEEMAFSSPKLLTAIEFPGVVAGEEMHSLPSTLKYLKVHFTHQISRVKSLTFRIVVSQTNYAAPRMYRTYSIGIRSF